LICRNPEILLKRLRLDYEINYDKIKSTCCVHNGDNSLAMTVDFEKGIFSQITISTAFNNK
ncbi:MAG: hypothetical protein AABY22_32715, partial [Nanoarchaeota archaeon]